MPKKTLFQGLIGSLVQRLNSVSQNARRERLLKSLKYCGQDVILYMPVRIDDPGNVELGKSIGIAPFVHIRGKGGIKIGDNVMIGAHTTITSEGYEPNIEQSHETLPKGIVIEDDVAIGTHCVILPGVVIGKGAVVGAGSIVSKSVKPRTIVVTGRKREELSPPNKQA